MWKCKTANKGGTNLHIGTSPVPLLQDGEEGDTVQDPIEEFAAMEEVLSHPGASPKMPFRLGRTSWLPSEISIPWALMKPVNYSQGWKVLLYMGKSNTRGWRRWLTPTIFSRCSRNERLPYDRARDVEFCLRGPFNWAWRPTQMEALMKLYGRVAVPS